METTIETIDSQEAVGSPQEPESGQARTMRAILQPEYGSPDVLALAEIDKPIVGDDEVLVRVHAAAVNKGDVHVLTGKPYLLRLAGYGLLRPTVPVAGQEVAGRVEAIGRNVTAFAPGDEVFGAVKRAGFAEYVSAPQDVLAHKPANLTFEQAAAVPSSGLTALQGLRDVGQVQTGQKVLINGASGGVGTFAVQIARALGAEVTAVCSTRNVDQARSLGADEVIDYTKEDFTRRGQRYDVMFDVVGNHSIAECRNVLNPKGVYVGAAGSTGNWIGPLLWMLRLQIASAIGSQKVATFVMKVNRGDLEALKQLIEAGSVTPVIERRYALSEVPEALRYVAEGHSQAKSVITI